MTSDTILGSSKHMRRPDYIRILMCLEEPRIVSEVISCAIDNGVDVSPTTIKAKLYTLERWGLIKMERVGKYIVVVAKKSAVEKIKKLSKEKKA
jgi:DNA-binding transcriptional ArsR family regulator